MTQSDDDESATEKFQKFETALKQVLTAPKPPPSGNGENSTTEPDLPAS